jgi:cobalamin-dependent methionine synthase I
MPIPNLTIIGESINDSVPSTKKLFDAGDIDGLLELARTQDQGGAAFIDVNVGPRSAEFMADLVKKIQTVTKKPLSIDSPDPDIVRAGLQAYDPRCADGQRPVLNSITALRTGMFGLYKVQPFRPILLISEQVIDGRSRPCRTVEESYNTAKELLSMANDGGYAIPIEDCIIDPGIAPIGSDAEGNLKRLIGAMEKIHADPAMKGVHMSVGLSNFTVMLPPKRADGSPVKGPLESAFLTKAMPLGLDMVIGSVKRNYQLLSPDHPAMLCLEDCLRASGFDVIMRVREFYS